MTRDEAVAQVRAVARHCRGTLAPGSAKVVKALLSDGRIAEAEQADAAGRTRCGYDFNETILAGQLDGERHEYECPECGLTGFYWAPLFEIEAGAARTRRASP